MNSIRHKHEQEEKEQQQQQQNELSSSSCCCCKVYVTGFGPFYGVTENPTTILVRNLLDYISNNNNNNNNTTILLKNCCIQPIVLEVSVIDVQKQMLKIKHDIMSGENQYKYIIFIHLGVNQKAKSIHLEQCAYNVMDFRAPDEQGYQPRNEPIILPFAAATTADVVATGTTTTLEKEKQDDNPMDERHRYRFPLAMKCDTLLDVPALLHAITTTTTPTRLITKLVDEDNEQKQAGSSSVSSGCEEDDGGGATISSSEDKAVVLESTTTATETICNDDTTNSNHNPYVTISTDPGRFVCNYTYCYSLDTFQCSHQHVNNTNNNSGGIGGGDGDSDKEKKPIVRSIFVHVPDFTVISEEIQLEMIVKLIIAIKQQMELEQ